MLQTHARTNRVLIAWCALLTLVLAWRVPVGAAAPRVLSVDTLDVHRINLREDDGTVRLIIASRDHFPGLIEHNREHPHPDRADAAGMIFYNDEGTENGGLIFGGSRSAAGTVSSFGHLSFDQYEQDQVVNLEQTEDAGQRYGGLTIADRPDEPIDFGLVDRLGKMPPAQRAAQLARLRANGAFGQPRVFVGKDEQRDAEVVLRDARGRARLRLRVTAAGAAVIEFLDERGRSVRTVSAP